MISKYSAQYLRRTSEVSGIISLCNSLFSRILSGKIQPCCSPQIFSSAYPTWRVNKLCLRFLSVHCSLRMLQAVSWGNHNTPCLLPISGFTALYWLVSRVLKTVLSSILFFNFGCFRQKQNTSVPQSTLFDNKTHIPFKACKSITLCHSIHQYTNYGK